MRAVTPAFGVIIEGNEMVVEHTVTITLPSFIDMDVTLACESVEIERQLTTDMPQDTRILEGYPTAQATVVLSGLVDPLDESKTAAWLFGPDSTDSPLYRAARLRMPVKIEQGIITADGVELVRTFTGHTDEIKIDNVTGAVTIVCLDPFTVLRPSVTLPSFGCNYTVTQGASSLTVRTPIAGTWVMENILRQNGIIASVPTRDGCVLFASMHGCAWPEIAGDFDVPGVPLNVTVSDDLMPLPLPATPANLLAQTTQGYFSPQVVRNPFLEVPLAGWDIPGAVLPDVSATGHFYVDGWVYLDSTQEGLGGFVTGIKALNGDACLVDASWSMGDATASFEIGVIRNSIGTLNVPLTGSINTDTWTHFTLLVQFTGATTADVTIILDANTGGAVTYVTHVTGLTPPGPYSPAALGAIRVLGYADTMQMTTETAPAQFPGLLEINAVLDPSLNSLIAIPDTTGLDAKTVIQNAAEAEQGIAGFDEIGTFRFTNRQTLRTGVSQRTITSDTSLKQLASDEQAATVATHIQAAVNAVAIGTVPITVWSAPSLIAIPAGGTYNALVTTSDITLTPPMTDSGFAHTIPTHPVTCWRAARAPTGGTPVTTGIGVFSVMVGATTMALGIINTNPFPVYMVSPIGLTDTTPGTPFVYVAGIAAVAMQGVLADSQWPPAAEGGAVTNPTWGDILLPLPSNVFRQDAAMVQQLTDDLLADLNQPRPLITGMSIVADPRLQLADVVTIQDPDGSRMDDDAQIVGLHIVDSATDWTQTVDARRVGAPGGWLMGVVGRSEMGVATYV